MVTQGVLRPGTKRRNLLFLGCGFVASAVLCNYVLAGRSTSLLWDALVTGIALGLLLCGLILVVRALRPKLNNFGLVLFAIGVVSSYGVVYAITIGLLVVSSESDYGHCEEMIQSIAATAPIPMSAFDPSHPAVFCKVGNYGLFRTRYQVLEVYGVSDRAKQDEILMRLKQTKHRLNTQAVQVLFYEKENVQFRKNDKNGSSEGIRGPESVLRIATVH